MDAALRIDLRLRLRQLMEPTIEDEGLQLVAVEITGDSRGTIMRLFVDGPGGVTIDDCARISRSVSPILDVENPIQGNYRLEVSSPGIDRPIETAADFERFAGFRAKIRTVPGSGRRRFTGILGGFEEDHILIQIDDEEHRLPLTELDWAHLVLELDEFTRLQAVLAEGAPPTPESISATQGVRS